MRSSVLPRSRPLGRICDTCQQRRRFAASTTTRLAAPTSVLSPRPHHPTTRPHAESARRHFTPAAVARAPPPSSSAAAAGEQQPAGGAAPEQPSSPGRARAVPPTHYELFPQTLPRGPPPAGPFEVDARALRREFLQLQAQAHPDLHPAAAKGRAEAASARINDAYRTLAAPLARAQYLLALRGRDVANDETAKVDDPALLLEVLEARERIEEAADEAELHPLRAENAERERAGELALARAFARDDLDAAAREVVRLRYWVNIRESIDNWERGKPVVLEH